MAQWETGKQTIKPSTYSSGYFIMIPLKKNGFLVWFNKFFLQLQIQQNHQVLSKAGRGFGSAIFFFNYNSFDTIWAKQPHKTLGHFGDIFFLMKCLQSSAPKTVCSNVPPPSISHRWVVPIHIVPGLVSGTKRICYDSFKVRF